MFNEEDVKKIIRMADSLNRTHREKNQEKINVFDEKQTKIKYLQGELKDAKRR